MQKLFKAWFQDSIRGVIALVVSGLIAIPAAILFLVVPIWMDTRYGLPDWILIAAGAAWIAFFLFGLWLIIFLVNRRRRKWLDSVFCPLGLTGHRYMINWYEYTGQVKGRDVQARFYRGPTLQIAVSTNLRTRFGIGESEQPGLAFAEHVSSKQGLVSPNPELGGLVVYPLDEAWTMRALDDRATSSPVQRLMNTGASWALIRNLILSPGQLQFTLYRNKNLYEYSFTPEEARQWVDDLLAVISSLENQPPPTLTSESTKLELNARSGKMTRVAIWITLAFFGLCLGSMLLVLWVVGAFSG